MSKENYYCVNVASDGETSVGESPPAAYARPRSSAQPRKGFILGRDRGTKDNRRKTDERERGGFGRLPAGFRRYIFSSECISVQSTY